MANAFTKFDLRNKAVPAVWQIAKQELKAARCPWRLRLNKNYPWMRVRRFEGGQPAEDFKLESLFWFDPDDVREARDLCLLAQRLGHWPEEDVKPKVDLNNLSWEAVSIRTLKHLKDHFYKEGSRKHYEAYLKHQISLFTEDFSIDKLTDWVKEATLPDRVGEFRRRVLMLNHIDLAIPEIDLADEIYELRKIVKAKLSGARAKVAKIGRDKVRVIPQDSDIQNWLDSMDKEYSGLKFYQLMFAYIATYGLRPHELWHIESINDDGWLTIPGGDRPDGGGHSWRTKSAFTHQCPPIPSAWLDRYQLRENLEPFKQAIRQRWPIRWRAVTRENSKGIKVDTGFSVPTNNALLGRYVSKLLKKRAPSSKQPTPGPATIEPLMAPLAVGDGTAELVPYDLRHSYAIRAAVHPETINWPMSQQAEWQGHSETVHRDTYLKWIDQARRDAGISAQISAMGATTQSVPDDYADLIQQLEKAKRQLAALTGL